VRRSPMNEMYVMASLSVSIRERRFSYANVGTCNLKSTLIMYSVSKSIVSCGDFANC